jgi:hypothetical protein
VFAAVAAIQGPEYAASAFYASNRTLWCLVPEQFVVSFKLMMQLRVVLSVPVVTAQHAAAVLG